MVDRRYISAPTRSSSRVNRFIAIVCCAAEVRRRAAGPCD